MDPLLFAFSFTFLIILVRHLFSLYRRAKNKNSCKTILILGEENSGKTMLYNKLMDRLFFGTIVSRQIKKSRLSLEAQKDIYVIDFPAYVELRPQLQDHLKITDHILFLLNRTTIVHHIKSISDYAYNILTHDYVHQNNLPVTFLITDMSSNTQKLTDMEVKKMLELEMNLKRKEPRANPIDGQSKGIQIQLGDQNEYFEFEHLPMKITFASLNLKNDTRQIKELLAQFV